MGDRTHASLHGETGASLINYCSRISAGKIIPAFFKFVEQDCFYRLFEIMKRCLILICMCLAALSCDRAHDCTLSGLCAGDFRAEVDGKTTSFYTLTNSNGMEVCVTDYGARILSIMVPDRRGRMTNVVVGFDNIADYLAKPVSHGAVIGRYANRIADASFVLDGQRYDLDRNSGQNCIHGGTKSWKVQMFSARQPYSSTLVLTIDSPDREMGFPGNVHAEVTYKVTEDNALDISYTATTDKPTVLNLTSHSFFNLSGKRDYEIWDHVLYVDADRYTPVNEGKVPTGEILPARDGGIDYTVPRPPDREFDINMVLNHPGDTNVVAASLYAPDTGIRMDVYTDQPGMVTYVKGTSVCLETQNFPDSPNQPAFPSSVLRPGETYRHRCIYRFSTGRLQL